MAFDHAWIFPVLTATCALAAFFIGYAIGVSNGDEYAWLSYISDGGAIPPQSCIFGQLLNLSAVFMAITTYLRYLQFIDFYVHRHNVACRQWQRVNFGFMILGFFIAFGISVVANFQVIKQL
ncbi:hypothetical protein L596_004111 [Steinernema carpocapsae]|uniref:CWH43-like N-terminal domain-containing protein n=1 Tax=Steinernema carpocapsae TaxID=34508 RepID=A0A4U8UWC6_STECR|nr:hypothetical protein L596_004111 [Steinernema carpocapsae]